MKDLRERCEKLISDLYTSPTHHIDRVNALESFAREIHNEALEDAANHFDTYISLEAHEEHWVAEEIRKFKTTALAASGDDK